MKTILEISSWKEIEAQFLSFLQMTENPCEFLMWNTATIAKVFTVADVIANTTNLHLPIPTALDCGYIKICFNKPIQTLLRSILASPYLSWFGAKFPIIFQQTLHQSSLRIGQNDTAVIACEILAMRLSTACNSNTSSMSHHYRRYQEEIMGFEHLHLIQKARCSNCALPLNFKNPISEVIDDMIKLRMVVIALALPPCGIACIFKSTQSSSHTSASCALQITDELSLSQLWDVLFQQASTAPSKILAIDPSFELIFQLIARNPLFCETFLRNLIVHPKFKSVESHVPFSIVTDKGVGVERFETSEGVLVREFLQKSEHYLTSLHSNSADTVGKCVFYTSLDTEVKQEPKRCRYNDVDIPLHDEAITMMVDRS